MAEIEKKKEVPEVEMVEAQEREEESDGADDLVADESLNLTKKKSIVYK